MGSLSAVDFVVAVVSIFVGATVQSTVGFGIGMVAMPILF